MTFGLEWTDFVPFFPQRGVDDPIAFGAILLLSTLLDLAILWAIVLRGGHRAGKTLDFTTLARGTYAVAGLHVVRLPLLVALARFNGFAAINLVWCDLVFAMVPCAALAWLQVLRGRKATRFARVALGLAIAFAPAAAWARFVEPFRLKVERSELDVASEGEPLRIAVLTDFQCDRITDYERSVVDRLLALEPDVILIPGDLYQGSQALFEQVKESIRAQLARLDAPCGVFYVSGDVDPPYFQAPLLDGTRIRRIDDSIVQFEARGRSVSLCGVNRESMLGSIGPQLIRRLEDSHDDLRLLVAHFPDVAQWLPHRSRVDLTVAGHTHGGQIVIPFLGPPMTLTSAPREIAAGGLHRWNGNAVYVSRGAGMERSRAPRIRFLCPPEISLITIL